MASPTALVTGCTGTIGRRVVHQLAERGYAVVAVNRDVETGREDERMEAAPSTNNKETRTRLWAKAAEMTGAEWTYATTDA